MLELHQICKTFNLGTINEKMALNHLTFTLKAGDFATVIGGNGVACGRGEHPHRWRGHHRTV